MKRLFIHFSNLFILIFLLWIAFISPNTVIHRSLPVIGILQKESLLTNYYILSGNLTLEKLDQKLHDLGFSKSFMNKPNPLQNFMVFFSSGSQSLALVIFIISFAALTIIQKTLEMRSAGIRYISGIRRYQLFGHSLMEDGKELFLGCIGGSVLGAILIYYLQLTPFAYSLIISASIIYNTLLFILSAFLSFFFAFSIQTVHLVSLLKGKIPLKRVLFFLFTCQFLAITVIGLSIHRVSIYGSIWQTYQEGSLAWSKETNWIQISLNRENVLQTTNKEMQIEQIAKWSKLIESGIEKGGLLVHHQLAAFNSKGFMNDPRTGRELSITDYDPLANTLYVTPNYLDIQRILVSPEEKERLNHLQAGEFGLLLPEKLKGQEEELKKRYEDYLTPSDEQGKSQLPMKARVTYLPNNQKRFIYNNTPMIYQQFLTDPILVVVLPRSFGGYDNPYFSHLNSYLYFDGLEKSKKLVVENGLEKNVSQYDYAASVYQQMIQSIQLENLITIAGGIFAIATSILLFNTMNFLYFEEFRRPIFLKKIAGLGFVKIHQMILLSESILLLLGSFLTFLLTQEWWIALVTLLLFITNAWFILLYRSHKEDHLLATVLKGA
ncbi:bacteriocine associated ABC transporter permease [Streptococcus pneumoniae]|nr:bacteriocine associated ABC transporter permease [Streptococcus pneumoniae]VOB01921.1 bacteriocine associated ABC transporter permease [Streptococcus pneumoniae]